MKAQSINPDQLKVKLTYAEKSSGKWKGVGTVCVGLLPVPSTIKAR
jgi:hypothetical protein